MTSILAWVVCPLVGLLALFWSFRRVALDERKWLGWAFAGRMAAAFALVGYHEYVFRGGDMLWYVQNGRNIAALLRIDFGRWAPEVFGLLIHAENALPVTDVLAGTPTGSMSAIAGILLFLTGDSLIGACLLVAFASHVGCTCLFRALEPELSPSERRGALIATQLLPSVVFWTSGIVKEGIVMGGLGFLALGFANALRGKFRTIPVGIFGAFVVALIKPYVAIAFAFAFGAAALFTRRTRFGWPTRIAGVVLGAAGVVLLARFFPEFGVERLGETMARSQYFYSVSGGGSNLDFGTAREEDIAGASLGTQLQFLPLAIINALTRPLPFDIRNASQAFAAVEMTALIWMVGRAILRVGPRMMWSRIRESRWKMLCFGFVLAFAVPVGLATRNLGTLSRYRVPMMPAYVALVLALQPAPARRRSEVMARQPLRRRPSLARTR
jgi:hypothetical protein